MLVCVAENVRRSGFVLYWRLAESTEEYNDRPDDLGPNGNAEFEETRHLLHIIIIIIISSSSTYNGYWVFPGGKVPPGRAADHSPCSSAAVMEE